MRPDEARSLGHLLYAGIFTAIPQLVYASLYEEYTQEQDPELFDIGAVSAEHYLEKYAQIYGLNTSMLKHWAHQASIEVANAAIPILVEERERLTREEWWSKSQIEEYTQDIINPIIEIAQEGIQSSVEYHSHLVGEAYYMDRDLGEDVPLNSSLVRGIFDNRANHA